VSYFADFYTTIFTNLHERLSPDLDCTMVIRAEHRFKKEIIVNLKLCAQDMQDICTLDQAEVGHGAFFDTLLAN